MKTTPKTIFVLGALLIIGIVIVGVLLATQDTDDTQQAAPEEQNNQQSLQDQEPVSPEATDQDIDTIEIPIVTTTVVMRDDYYEPAYLIMKKGSTIIWKNESSSDKWPASDVHPSHTIYPEFDPKRPIPPGESWSFTFDKAGEWDFHDHIKPSITGNVTITE
ncbi:MAG: hypothetical protein F4X82_02375 [Candidatus Spechtbacteria bacterium SB0662_bin_43]|uniref:EfeO-type cupredoxin-like domain-containing protein n=1 Tax=Candidatus Spechtbacteria bacterium SB0662_bin_43 TaxID=2604897 RepID=A0A845DJG9_9BACT|nr:hypothetical protein [Candidatus Spechtbacteria bacterium SB0662_bin_43]